MKLLLKSVLLVAFLWSSSLYSQSDPPLYYVVIGAFRIVANAERLTQQANQQNLTAKYAINSAKDLYYVYVLETAESKKAFSQVIKTKAETEFKDAWVFKGRLGNAVIEKPKSTPEPIEKKEEPTVEKEVPIEPVIEPVVENKEEPKPVVVEPEPVVETKPDSTLAQENKPKPEGKPFFFRMISEATGNAVVGEIHVLESGRATQYQAFRSNELIYLPAPKNRTGTYQIITLAPGYKEMKRPINYVDPSASASETGPDQEFIISLPLVRVKMGDYIEFSNVRFFQNTAILQPESQNELDGLAQLLKENERYKIKIHGHVNGEGARDIVSKGTSPDYFATHRDNLRESGSAARLSQLRADIVKEYLIAQGIDGNRISAKGEGGKQMIYPRNSTLSGRNDRVEVEVKKGK
jgi:outer membrane protein OmpA-like peptidoglycan-associated protein